MSSRRRLLVALLLGIAALAAASELLVPPLIGAVHRGTGIAALDRVMSGRDAHSAEYYDARWRSMARPSLAVLGGLWLLLAVVSRPAVSRRLAAWLAIRGEEAGPPPVLPTPGRRRLVAGLAAFITGGSLLELALDPPYRREHWPFSQYQMYSLLPRNEVSMRRLYGVVKGRSGREIPLWDGDSVHPFDNARLWFSWNRLDASPDRERLLPIALRDVLERYESRRAHGLHDGPPLEAVRLYRIEWTLGTPTSDLPRELLWEVRTSPPTPSPSK
jgi:hypothetical protein